jgi:hypothetical protein
MQTQPESEPLAALNVHAARPAAAAATGECAQWARVL